MRRRELLKYTTIGALAFGVPLLLPKRAWAVWDKGFDFRGSAGAETDPADCTYVLNTDTGSTTRNGATFQWTVGGGNSLGGIDNNVGNDARLEGINYTANGGAVSTWRLTLPATGVYDIWLAAGNANNAQTNTVVLKDNTTAFVTLTSVSTPGNEFVDASGTVRTAAAWVSASARGGTKVTRTFASTTLNLELGNVSGGSSSCLAHVFISQVGAGEAPGIIGHRRIT